MTAGGPRVRTFIGGLVQYLGTFLVFATGAGAAASLVIGGSAVVPVPEWGGELRVDAPTTLVAGDVLQVDIRSPDAPAGAEVEVVLIGAVETHVIRDQLNNGAVTVRFGSDLTDHSGLVSIRAAVGRTRAGADVMITPRAAVSPVVPLVGPRTIIADETDRTMVVALPMDRFGNPVASGTPVDISFGRTTGEPLLRQEVSVAAGIAATQVRSGPKSGRVAVQTLVGDADGPLNFFDEVASTPVAVSLVAAGAPALADGFSLFEVETNELRDGNGNLLPDGVVATFRVTGASGISQTTATVQNGVARTTLEAPDRPGPVDVRVRVSGVDSESLTIDFAPAVIEIPISATIEPGVQARVEVAIGPVNLASGGYVPDGTPLLLELRTGATTNTSTDALVVRSGALRGGTEMVVVELAGERLIGRELTATVEILGAVAARTVGIQ